MIVDGKKIADSVLARLRKQSAPKKFFGILIVGDDPATASFVKQKEKVAKELGIDFRIYTQPVEATNDVLREEVRKLSNHKTCGGFVVQLPLPEQVNCHYVLNAVPREKDVDVLGERALGAFYTERNTVMPPVVGTVEAILQTANYKLQATSAAVVGLGFLIGRPIALWLVGRAKELHLLREGSDLSQLQNADLVISGVGKAGIITPDILKDSAGVIDFGYDVRQGTSGTRQEKKISGDFDTGLPTANYGRLAFYTPTPGGTGPVLVAKLFENFYTLNSGR